MLKKLACAAAVALPTLGMAGAAQASLIGQTVTCSDNGVFFNAKCDAPTASVGPGAEFEIFTTLRNPPLWAIDLGADSIVMTFVIPNGGAIGSDGGRVTLGDLFWSNDPAATIVGIANFTAVGVEGVTESDITVNDNSIVITYVPSSGATWAPGDFISFDLVTSKSQQLPEPASLALFGLGLAGLGVAARRRRCTH